MRNRDTTSTVLQGLTLLFAALTLWISYGEWAGFGHRHADADGVYFHNHAYTGGHRHLVPGGDPADPLAPDSEAPAEAPADSGSSDTFLASSFLFSLDLKPALVVQRPSYAVVVGVAPGQAPPTRDTQGDLATPRGPPAA